MPTIKLTNEIEITPEKFLRACSDNELKETLLLLNSKQYASRIHLDDSVTDVEYKLRDISRELKESACSENELKETLLFLNSK